MPNLLYKFMYYTDFSDVQDCFGIRCKNKSCDVIENYGIKDFNIAIFLFFYLIFIKDPDISPEV